MFGITGIKGGNKDPSQEDEGHPHRSLPMISMECLEDPTLDLDPEKRLLVAIITQAIFDLLMCKTGTAAHRDAVSWFNGRHAEIRFDECCDYLNLDKEVFLRLAYIAQNYPHREEIERNMRVFHGDVICYSPKTLIELIEQGPNAFTRYVLKMTRFRAKNKQLCDDLLVATSSTI